MNVSFLYRLVLFLYRCKFNMAETILEVIADVDKKIVSGKKQGEKKK